MNLPAYKLIGDPFQPNGSTTYHQRYRLLDGPRRADGRPIPTGVSLETTDKAIARRRAVEFVERKIRKQIDASDPAAEHRHKSLAQHLADFQADKLARKIGPRQVKEQIHQIELLCAGCKFTRIEQISELPIIGWLGKKSPSDQTSINYIAGIKCFTRWLAKHKRLSGNPIAEMDRRLGRGDIKTTFERRPWRDAEFQTLVANARKSKIVKYRLDGESRSYLYLVAAYTGFRAGELASLMPESFDLRGNEPSVTIDCTISNRRRHDRQILPLAVATLLKPWLASRPGGLLWPGRWYRKAKKLMAVDMAGLNPETKEGVLHFHSARHGFMTKLAESGASDREIMEVGRLSSSALVKRYAHFDDARRSVIVGRLTVPECMAE